MTKIFFPPHIIIGEEDKQYYEKKHDLLPEMEENQFQISGIEMITQNGEIIVPTFIRSTVSKPVTLKSPTILLVDDQFNTIAKTRIDFNKLIFTCFISFSNIVIHKNNDSGWLLNR